jgi:hypothetical protein
MIKILKKILKFNLLSLFISLNLLNNLNSAKALTNLTIEQEASSPILYFFHGAECPHCHNEKKFFPELRAMYPQLKIKEFEIWHHPENKILLEGRLANLNQKYQGVPTNIINNQVFVGFQKDNILKYLKSTLGEPQIKISREIHNNSQNSNKYLTEHGLENTWWSGILNTSWPIMSFVLGFIDGFNPCAMWTLFILLGFLLSFKDKKKQYLIGGIFIASSALIYLAALLAYYFGFKTVTQTIALSAMDWVFLVIGLISILTGLNSLFTAKNKGVECDIRDAQSKQAFQKKLKTILEREKLWLVLIGVIILAFSVNAFELLCSIAIPTIYTATIIDLKLSTWQAISGILIYDFAYILDDILVFIIAIKTLSLKVFNKKLVQISNLVGAILLIILGLFLLIDSELFIATIFKLI